MIKDWISKIQNIIAEPLVAFGTKHHLTNEEMVELSAICTDIESEIRNISGYYEELQQREKELNG